MTILHLVPAPHNRFWVIEQADDEPFTEAQALAITKGETSIHAEHVGAMLSHPAWRTRYADILIHR